MQGSHPFRPLPPRGARCSSSRPPSHRYAPGRRSVKNEKSSAPMLGATSRASSRPGTADAGGTRTTTIAPSSGMPAVTAAHLAALAALLGAIWGFFVTLPVWVASELVAAFAHRGAGVEVVDKELWRESDLSLRARERV